MLREVNAEPVRVVLRRAPLWLKVIGGACGVAVAWAVAARLLPRGLPSGVVLQGLVLGGLTSLTAMGLVLVYRASRVFNFAQGSGAMVAQVE